MEAGPRLASGGDLAINTQYNVNLSRRSDYNHFHLIYGKVGLVHD